MKAQRPRLAAIIGIALLFVPFSTPVASQPAAYDLILKNGVIVDGTGRPAYRGEVAISGDAIVEIAARIDRPAKRVIDVNGQAIAPGFIDIHTHARRGIFEVPTADNYVRQGVTTVIEGPDGGSPVPLAPFLQRVEALKTSVNFGTFIGQGSVRSAVMENVDRKPTPDEIERMLSLVDQGMKDGAFGLSSGLFYVPGRFSTTDEVVELAKVASRKGGIYISHMRDEANKVLDSVTETIGVGERGGLPTQITHHKIVGKKNWGQSLRTLQLVDRARSRGVDATIDQYPYTASSTSVAAALLPAWALEGTREAVLARLENPDLRAKVKAETIRMIRDERGGGDPRNVALVSCGFDATLAGKNLADVTRLRGMPVTIPNAAEATLWLVEQGGCQGVFHAMNESDLVRILKHPQTMIASDGEIPIFGRANPHPRSYGTFARVLGRYVRVKKILTLAEAVRKMTSFPAQRLGLSDRGALRKGMKADIAIFDPVTVRDMATFEKPHQYSQGFSFVIVNGQVVFENGQMTAARPGKVLYHRSKAMNKTRRLGAENIVIEQRSKRVANPITEYSAQYEDYEANLSVTDLPIDHHDRRRIGDASKEKQAIISGSRST